MVQERVFSVRKCLLVLLDFLPDSQNEFLLTIGFVRNSGETMRIFVGNLSYQTTETDLTNLFEQIGPVESANIITDRDTGRWAAAVGLLGVGAGAGRGVADAGGVALIERRALDRVAADADRDARPGRPAGRDASGCG